MRTFNFQTQFTAHARGSVLIEMGNTKVLCTAMIVERVPRFLYRTGNGWLTAEYDMLPSATPDRYPREARRGQIKGRTSEIQRLIGRSLRSAINLEMLGERTLYVDCDVLEADGGTRTASITGGFAAMALACCSLVEDGVLEEIPLVRYVAALSVGVVDGEVVVDLDYEHDSNADVDMNVVMDDSKRIIEVQGTAEKKPFSRTKMKEMVDAVTDDIERLIAAQKEIVDFYV